MIFLYVGKSPVTLFVVGLQFSCPVRLPHRSSSTHAMVSLQRNDAGARPPACAENLSTVCISADSERCPERKLDDSFIVLELQWACCNVRNQVLLPSCQICNTWTGREKVCFLLLQRHGREKMSSGKKRHLLLRPLHQVTG